MVWRLAKRKDLSSTSRCSSRKYLEPFQNIPSFPFPPVTTGRGCGTGRIIGDRYSGCWLLADALIFVANIVPSSCIVTSYSKSWFGWGTKLKKKFFLKQKEKIQKRGFGLFEIKKNNEALTQHKQSPDNWQEREEEKERENRHMNTYVTKPHKRKKKQNKPLKLIAVECHDLIWWVKD